MVRERVEREGRLGNLAEFGCGTGFYTSLLAGRADRVVATDLSPGMLALARANTRAANVTFQVENCERTSFPDGAFDSAFVSLVLHFTEPAKALAEMHRILKPGGTLLVSNLDPGALGGLDKVRGLLRVLYRGLTGYRLKPPKGFAKNMLTLGKLRDLLGGAGFDVLSAETVKDPFRTSSIPVDYVRAMRGGPC
jgi:ABC-2 type transport system ATP-binding protein